jgi:hypothetical protein
MGTAAVITWAEGLPRFAFPLAGVNVGHMDDPAD